MTYHYDGKGFQDYPDVDIAPDVLREMFYSMLRIRRIEEVIESKYKEDQMKTPIHLVIGQEATSVGVCMAMEKTDLVFAGHRTHGNYLAKGGDLKRMLAEFFCRKTGCAGSRGGSMHLIDKSVGMAGSSAICGGAPPLATGAALSAKLLRTPNVICVFFGDGAAEEGSVWESMNFAALKRLPILYFCENNFYSVCSPLSKRQPPNTRLYKKAAAFGVTSETVDGTNVVDVFQAARRAISGSREGKGPFFIEAPLYRWRAHGGAGDDLHLKYRDREEGNEWHKFCPVEGFGDYLKRKKLLNDSDRTEMESRILSEIKEAFEFAISSPEPTESDLYTFVYAD